jgi:uncharacterized UBP type Zn finger protein
VSTAVVRRHREETANTVAWSVPSIYLMAFEVYCLRAESERKVRDAVAVDV